MNRSEPEMRMLDAGRKHAIDELQLYLSQGEAEELRDELNHLLADPEANRHFHLTTADGKRDMSCSIITPRKLAAGSYTDCEQRLFDE